MKNPWNFTVSQLKEKLRDSGLVSTGNKAEVISRLDRVDPSGGWMDDISTAVETNVSDQEDEIETGATASAVINQEHETGTNHRERELAKQELQTLRRELKLIEEMQQLNVIERNQATKREELVERELQAL